MNLSITQIPRNMVTWSVGLRKKEVRNEQRRISKRSIKKAKSFSKATADILSATLETIQKQFLKVKSYFSWF